MQRRELVKPRDGDPVLMGTLPWSRGGMLEAGKTGRRSSERRCWLRQGKLWTFVAHAGFGSAKGWLLDGPCFWATAVGRAFWGGGSREQGCVGREREEKKGWADGPGKDGERRRWVLCVGVGV